METKERMIKEISGRLKRYRLENDLTLEEIANRAGIATPTVYRIENGLVKPNERTIYKLRKSLPGLFENAA